MKCKYIFFVMCELEHIFGKSAYTLTGKYLFRTMINLYPLFTVTRKKVASKSRCCCTSDKNLLSFSLELFEITTEHRVFAPSVLYLFYIYQHMHFARRQFVSRRFRGYNVYVGGEINSDPGSTCRLVDTS